MREIYEYLDYREFLRDKFEDLKKRRGFFSYRAFARLAGFSASNFLMLVMQGKRNLSGDGIQKVARALKLRKGETEFFENLVRFNQSSTDDEKNFYYRRTAENRRYSRSKEIEKSQYEYYSTWYHTAVYELVGLPGFSDDSVWIARRLIPPVTAGEAKDSFELLKKLGFVRQNREGGWEQVSPHLKTADEVKSLAVANYHREMIARAGESIDRTKAAAREIGSVTFGISAERMREAKKMIREFRSKMASYLSEEKNPQAVYQLNIQLFNLSKLPEVWP